MSRIIAALAALGLLLGLSAPALADPPTPAPGHHLMLDTASAPDLRDVQSWQAKGTYSAIAVYVPVASRYDSRYDKVQSNLVQPGWVSAVRSGGWNVLPIYLGLQASCSGLTKAPKMSSNATTARAQGVAAAADAAASVYKLGIPVSAPIVFDLEAYPTGNAKCTAAAQAFIAGWTVRLHQLGRNSGLYGSINSTITDASKAYATAGYVHPDVIWVARPDGQADTTFTMPPADQWVGRRLHQFGQSTLPRVTDGKQTTVDDNAVQDSVWRLPPPDRTAPTLAVAAVRTTHHAHVTLGWKMHDSSGVAHYQVQIKTGAHWTTPKGFKKTTKTTRRVAIKYGGKVCARARGTDRAGNTSGWLSSCVYRWQKGSALHGKGWKRKGSALTVTHSGKTAWGPVVTARRFAFTVRGHNTLQVKVGSHVVGTVGPGSHVLTLPAAVHGKLSLRTLRHGKVKITAWVATP